MSTNHDTQAGQAIYSKLVLSIYDLWVLGFSNSLLWKCPTRLLRSEFSQLASDNHLDMGVGTGYYLKKCLERKPRRLALADLNLNSLQAAAQRVKYFAPECHQVDLLRPFELSGKGFDSMSLNYLLHCLPGSMAEKTVIFEHLQPHLNANGIVFGSTILGNPQPASKGARKLMATYNNKGIFCNEQDDLSSLEKALNQYFNHVNLRVEGCVAIFSARKK